MNKISVVPFKRDFIDALSDYILSLGYGKDLSKICVVFPGKRPSLFLVKALGKKIDEPFIPPTRFSIDEFMEFLFQKKRDERIPEGDIDLIYLLYRAIRESGDERNKGLDTIAESMGTFVQWGGKILRAIEEIELEWGEESGIEELALYDENIIEWARNLLKRFTAVKERFHNLLKENKLTYRGEVYRYVSEHIEEIEPLIPFPKIIFSGFYALNASEEKTMRYLFEKGRAEIIIQSDIIDNKEEIPKSSPYYFHQEWKKKWEVDFEEITKEREKEADIRFYQSFDTHSEILNVDHILNESGEIGDFAIVLPDPPALIPLLNIVASAHKNDFNITLGYPLKRTSLANLIKYIFSLQNTKSGKQGRYQYYAPLYLNLMRHPYIKTLEIVQDNHSLSRLINTMEKLIIRKNRKELKTFFTLEEIEGLIKDNKALGKIPGGKQNLEELLEVLKKVHYLFIREFEGIKKPYEGAKALKKCLKFVYENASVRKYPLSNQFFGTLLEKLEEIQFSLFSKIEDFDNSIQLLKFLENYLNDTRIPFSGEPLKGIQIMGLLETRNLNFDRVIIMDVNEGIIPGVEKYDPLLPQHFRSAIKIPGYTEKESIYAYNFFRLINGSREVHLLYKQGKLNTSDENIRSRFIERLLWGREKKGEKIELSMPVFKVEKVGRDDWEFPKSEKTLKNLREMKYHPTAIDTYINCPLKFYYRYVLHLEEWENIEEDIERSTIGIFIHKFLEEYYGQFLNTKVKINKKDFMKTLTKNLNAEFREGGGSIIVKEIIKKTLERFIHYELERTKESDILIRGLEKKFMPVEFRVDGEKFKIKGSIDRVEEIDGEYYIIDYKTGTIQKPNKDKLNPPDAEDRESIRKRIRSLQLPIYAYLYSQETDINPDKICAQYFNLRNPWEDNTLNNEKMHIFMDALKFILREITNTDKSFTPDNSDDNYCRYCPYSLICPAY